MKQQDAIDALSALAQSRRLDVFRLLVKAGRSGLPAGEIAEALSVPANTLSAQLGILSQAGLIEGRREGRSIIYSVQFDAVSDLIVWLMEDCCAGERDVAGPVQFAANRCCG
ncbi:MAG: metalloregulator ArsR/SmtB family transcription factor [Henriciella sp.]|uniref:ArsR/SmtB family transcription factor n=1 Tax=Henriciella sp. TaxID=1968823 RepID=UPI003C759189